VLCPDLHDFDLDRWLAALQPRHRIAIRHTIAGADPTIDERPDDGLPCTLPEILEAYGNRYFKIKIGADLEPAAVALAKIATILDRDGAPYWVTLDANEAFAETAQVDDAIRTLLATPVLARFAQRILYLEQPVRRADWRSQPVHRLALPIIIDESDATLEDFPRAHTLGYKGVSIKSCKGVYKALLNAARCTRLADGAFISAEDLNHPPGVALQQDLAVAALLGLQHAEKNGHHHIGFRRCEARAFETLTAQHASLYAFDTNCFRLRIERGTANLASLDSPGFASSGVTPATAAPRSMPAAEMEFLN